MNPTGVDDAPGAWDFLSNPVIFFLVAVVLAAAVVVVLLISWMRR
jgi:hypothetical protein